MDDSCFGLIEELCLGLIAELELGLIEELDFGSMLELCSGLIAELNSGLIVMLFFASMSELFCRISGEPSAAAAAEQLNRISTRMAAAVGLVFTSTPCWNRSTSILDCERAYDKLGTFLALCGGRHQANKPVAGRMRELNPGQAAPDR